MQFFAKEAALLGRIPFRVPRTPRFSQRIFAHLFSGRRRPGDVQEMIEARGATMLSIDIIFHVTLGDLSNEDTLSLFMRALAEGLLVGFLAGPPCETWSRARQNQLDGKRYPRPVREIGRPCGLRSLTYREHKQVSFGNRLLAITWRLTVAALCAGASAIIEHAAEIDGDLLHPSIWRTWIARFLLRFPVCRKTTVLQGHYHGPSAKPTDLFLVNVSSEAEQLLLQGRVSQVPKTASIGVGEDGSFKTAVLKEYPPALCAAPADIFVRSQPEAGTGQPMPAWFLDVIENLKGSFNENAERGPDFCAGGADHVHT